MEKYGYKQIVKKGEFREGRIVESTGSGEIICREYFINSEYELDSEDISKSPKIDIAKVAIKKTPIGQMREITKQLGIGNFMIDEEVVEMLS